MKSELSTKFELVIDLKTPDKLARRHGWGVR